MPSERDIFLGDIIVCIAEDFGYNSWRQVSSYHWTDEDPRSNYVTILALDEIEDGNDGTHKCDVNTVIKGINLIIDGKISVNDRIIKTVREANRDNDAGDIDAEISDIILQAGIFQSYIYG